MSRDTHVSEHGTRGEKRVVAACAIGVLLFVALVPLAVGEIGTRADDHGTKNAASTTNTTTRPADAATKPGSVTVMPRSLLPVPDDPKPFIGQHVKATSVAVHRVAARGRSFWIGDDAQHASVAYSPHDGDAQPAAGDHIDFNGDAATGATPARTQLPHPGLRRARHPAPGRLHQSRPPTQRLSAHPDG